MKLELTKKQAKALRKHFQAIDCASRIGRRGMLVAQLHEGWGEPYMRVGFLEQDIAIPLVGKAQFGFPRLPYGFAGIPPVPTSSTEPT